MFPYQQSILQVLNMASSVRRELMNVSFCRSANIGVFFLRNNPQNVVNELA